MSLENQRLQIGARRIDGGSVSGATGAENHNVFILEWRECFGQAFRYKSTAPRLTLFDVAMRAMRDKPATRMHSSEPRQAYARASI